MPEDCIVIIGYKGRTEDTNVDDIYDLYSQTSHLRDLGKQATPDEVTQSPEYQQIVEGTSNYSTDIGSAFYDLFS